MPFPVFEKQEEIPETFRGEYEEREGKWHPKVPDVVKLQTALDTERTNRAEEERKRKAAEELSAKLKREAEAKSKGIPDEELDRLRKEDAEKRKPIEEENARLKAENERLTVHDTLRRVGLEKGWMKDRLEAAVRDLNAQCDGKGRIRKGDSGRLAVYDSQGNITTQTVEDFLEKTFKAEAPWFYAGSGASGSGANESGGAGGGGGDGKTDAGKIADDMQKKREARPNPLLKR